MDTGDGDKGGEFDPAGVVFSNGVTRETAGVHAPVGFAGVEGGEHTGALKGHAAEASLDVAGPLGVAVALRSQVEVAIDGPFAKI